MYFFHTNWAGSEKIFNGKLSSSHWWVGGWGGSTRNTSCVTNLSWFWKRGWTFSFTLCACIDGCRQSSADFPLINTVQIYQSHIQRHVRAKKNHQSIPNMKQLSGQEYKKWHHPEMWSQAGRPPLEDRWLAVGISLRLADHHSEHADSLSGPPGDCENSVYKAREGESSESEEEVISSCKNEGSTYNHLQSPATRLFMVFLIITLYIHIFYSHFTVPGCVVVFIIQCLINIPLVQICI